MDRLTDEQITYCVMVWWAKNHMLSWPDPPEQWQEVQSLHYLVKYESLKIGPAEGTAVQRQTEKNVITMEELVLNQLDQSQTSGIDCRNTSAPSSRLSFKVALKSYLLSPHHWPLVTDFWCCDMSSPVALMRTLVMTSVVLRRVKIVWVLLLLLLLNQTCHSLCRIVIQIIISWSWFEVFQEMLCSETDLISDLSSRHHCSACAISVCSSTCCQ